MAASNADSSKHSQSESAMSRFLGKYKVVHQENGDAYLKAIGKHASFFLYFRFVCVDNFLFITYSNHTHSFIFIFT